MYTLRKARTSATDFVTCPEFCHVSWFATKNSFQAPEVKFSSKSKTLTWCFISPLCTSSVLSLLCSQLPWLSESLRWCWCWIWGTLSSHWRWILPISYVVFGGLPRRFGVEASWRHGTAFRSAERHMFDLQILRGLLGATTGTHCKICLDCWYQVVPPPSKKTWTSSAKERYCPLPHPNPPHV